MNFISGYCKINAGQVILNDKVILTGEEQAKPDDFLKTAYKQLQLNYPKFYKMDLLCKLAFLASELLIKSAGIMQKYAAQDIALVLSNSNGSLDTDSRHQQTISDSTNYFPSPASFVYTLPTILIGEIAIRNVIKGENTFFIFPTFDSVFMTNYSNSLLNTKRAACSIVGWVDVCENKYAAFLYVVERCRGELEIAHTAENAECLFN